MCAVRVPDQAALDVHQRFAQVQERAIFYQVNHFDSSKFKTQEQVTKMPAGTGSFEFTRNLCNDILQEGRQVLEVRQGRSPIPRRTYGPLSIALS